MPQLIFDIPEITDSVSRPVVFDVTRSLLKLYKLEENTNIIFPDEFDTRSQINSTITKEDKENYLIGDNKLVVEAEEAYSDGTLNITPILRGDHICTLIDDDLYMYVKPIYKDIEVTLTFKYRARDRTEAIRWRNAFRTKLSQGKSNYVLNIKYHYLFPEDLLKILKEVHRLRENVEPYNEDFNTYLARHAQRNISEITNVGGKIARLGVTEAQGRVVGFFDVDEGIGQVTKEDDTAPWNASVEFKFRYQCPVQFAIKYPLIVHNQVISEDFRITKNVPYVYEPLRTFQYSNYPHFYFETAFDVVKNIYDPIRIPDIDDYDINKAYSSIYVKEFIVALSQISSDDKKTLISLEDLGEFKLKDKFLSFMKTDYEWMLIPKESFFEIKVFENDLPLDYNTLEIEQSTLTIKSKVDLNLRKTYHVRVGIVTDLRYLSPGAIDRLKPKGPIIDEIVDIISPEVDHPPKKPDGGVSDKDMDNLIHNRGRGLRNMWVMNLIVTAVKGEENFNKFYKGL